MEQYYNPRGDSQHPCLSALYGVNVEAELAGFDIAWYTELRFIRKRISAAAAKSGSRTRDVRSVLHEVFRSSPKRASSTVSQKCLSKRAGMSERTVRKIISGLRQTGLMHVIHNYRNTEYGRRRTASTNIIIALRDWIIKKSNKNRGKSLQARNASQLNNYNVSPPPEVVFSTNTGEIFGLGDRQ